MMMLVVKEYTLTTGHWGEYGLVQREGIGDGTWLEACAVSLMALTHS